MGWRPEVSPRQIEPYGQHAVTSGPDKKIAENEANVTKNMCPSRNVYRAV